MGRLTVDSNSVNAEHTRDLGDDARSRGLDSVRVQNGGDIVRIEIVHVDKLVGVLPYGAEVRSLSEESSLWEGGGG